MPSYTASTPSERPDFVEPGDHQVEIIDAIETISKGGHESIELARAFLAEVAAGKEWTRIQRQEAQQGGRLDCRHRETLSSTPTRTP